MKGKRRRTKKKRVSFSKLLLLLESGIVLYTTYEGFALAKFAVASGFMGTLPWIATMVTAAWGAYGTSAACYYAKAKAENTAGGVTYENAITMRYTVLNSCATFVCTVSTQKVTVRQIVTRLFTLRRFASLFFRSSIPSPLSW